MKIGTVLLVAGVLLLPPFAVAETARQRLAEADAAARADRHSEAIALYEAAIAVDPALRDELLGKLGRQYLWNEQPERAIPLLSGHLVRHPSDCDVRFDYALAFLWSSRFEEARRELERVTGECPERATDARLRIALLERWSERPARAESIYREIASTERERKAEAETGLGFVALARDENRAARRIFARLVGSGDASAETYEGLAIALARLGLTGESRATIGAARSAGMVNRSALDLEASLRDRSRPAISPYASAFRDADGTEYTGGALTAHFGPVGGRWSLGAGSSELSDDRIAIGGQWLEGGFDFRRGPLLGVSATVRANDFDEVGFDPWTGELNLVVTPADRLRFDVAVARLIVADNIAAMSHHLEGDFVSAGFDWRMRPATTLSIAGDVTDWSEGNRRQRLRANLAHRFGGLPAVIVEWPTLYQTYDDPFTFGLFSPESYVETGPAVTVYRRFAPSWVATLRLRGGGQKESDADWKALASAWAFLDRDLRNGWSLRLQGSWSNSNVASSGGFRRSALTLQLVRTF